VLPLFVSEKIESAKEIASMPGICQYAGKEIAAVAQRAYEGGVQAVLLFGIPRSKDEKAREAYAESGVVQNAVRRIKKQAPDLTVITDVCLCEYTNHGHCGVTHRDGEHFYVLNDESVELIAKSAVSHAVAGADMVAPSDMMDGRIGAVRAALDQAGFKQTGIMSYAAKFSSVFYGPFRDAAESPPQFGDRRSYQMDPANADEALREVDGRKAIVIFSDGVDYRSDYATAESTLRYLEQDGVVVYPIRFSTRVAAEKLAREQSGSQLPTREIVRSTSGSKEPVPGEIPSSEPKTGPLGLPSPEEILRRRQDTGRNRDRLPPGDRPPAGEIGVDLPTGRSDPRVSSKGREKASTEDPIGVMLDRLYTTADTYLQSVVDKSGGQLLRADAITSLPGAFSQIATELRAQYFLGYDPTNKNRDDQYHVIKVTSTRPGLVIRARAGRRQGK